LGLRTDKDFIMATPRSAILAGALAVLLSACAAAPVQTASNSDKITSAMQGQTASDGSIIRCRSIKEIGTHFATKECKSETTWAEFDKMMALNAKEQTDKFQRLNSGCSTQGNCP
jgi:hypothetical protein